MTYSPVRSVQCMSLPFLEPSVNGDTTVLHASCTGK